MYTFLRENHRYVDKALTTYLPRFVNLVFERPLFFIFFHLYILSQGQQLFFQNLEIGFQNLLSNRNTK